MRFINNTARLSGAAIFASDLHGCHWFGDVEDELAEESIFTQNPPIAANGSWPFVYE